MAKSIKLMEDFPAKLDEWRVHFRRGLCELCCVFALVTSPYVRVAVASADPVPFLAGRLAQLLEASLTDVEPRQLEDPSLNPREMI